MHPSLNHTDPAVVAQAAHHLLGSAHRWTDEEYTRAVDACGAADAIATLDAVVEHARSAGRLNAQMLFIAAHEARNRGQHDKAASRFADAASLESNVAELHYEAAVSWVALGDAQRAISAFRTALKLAPELTAAAFNIATLSNTLQNFEDALVTLDAHPLDDEMRWMGLFERGRALAGLGRFDEACDPFQACHQLQPNAPGLQANFAKALHGAKRGDDAFLWTKRWQELEPDGAESAVGRLPIFLQNVAWSNIAKDASALALALNEPPGLGAESLSLMWWFDEPEAMLRIAKTRFHALKPLHIDRLRNQNRAPSNKIRVAVLSADLNDHPVGRTTVALWESLDRDRIELTAYSWTAPKPTAMKERLERAFDRVVNIHTLTDAAAAQRIHDDGIDVLIDAMGMTTNERHAILLARPARVNVGFWGYPGTTGGVCDYLIADRILVPSEASRTHYSEAIIRMPDTYASTASYPDVIAPMSRELAGLPGDAVVLASFNHIGKLTPRCLELWLRILHACPSALLWLPKGSQTAETNLIEFAQARGVDSSRIRWHRGGLPETDYLARLACADLALDSFPYGGHSTTCDILYMGVPVIALSGRGFAARASSSILSAAGLSELACETSEQYEALAIKLALDHELRARYRQRAANARASALFNQTKHAAALSNAVVRIGLRARQALPAEAFDL